MKPPGFEALDFDAGWIGLSSVVGQLIELFLQFESLSPVWGGAVLRFAPRFLNDIPPYRRVVLEGLDRTVDPEAQGIRPCCQKRAQFCTV